MNPLKAKRLFLVPMTDEDLLSLSENHPDPELRQAYREMLDGCRKGSKTRLWYTAWKICLLGGVCIGDVGFKGPPQNGAVEIGYGIDEAYRNQGYTTEAVERLMRWAFAQKDVYFIEAETEPNNAASQRVLQKLGFTPFGQGEEGPRFEKERPDKSEDRSSFFCIGIGLGVAVGVSTGNLGLWLPIGVAIGLCLGSTDRAENAKKRKTFRAARIAAQKHSD